jgi:hypothetical protein
MIIQVFYALVALFVLIGLINLVSALFQKAPRQFNQIIVALVEAGLLVQLLTTITVLISGVSLCRGSIWEFFGYLLVALLVPAGAVVWSLLEKTKQSVVILGAAPLVVAIMLYRMLVIWSGQ